MITAKTEKIALLGLPIDHSKSPEMINAAFSHMGADYIYTAFNVSRGKLRMAVEGLKALGFRGWNVTLPYKVEMQEYMDELDETACNMGAVNTVINENGRYIGYNTDGEGYLRSLMEEKNDLHLPSQRVVILGAGGVARSVGFALAKEGVHKMTIANRTVSMAEKLAQSLSVYCTMNAVSIQDCEKEISEATLLINATSVGMYPHVADIPVSSECLHPHLVVSDLVYNPMQTALLQAAEERGATIHRGIGMLVYQAAIAIELWSGFAAPVGVMRKTLEASGL